LRELIGVDSWALTLNRQFDYDAQGNRNQIWDGNGNLTQIDYNDRGRIIQVTNALDEETHLEVDPNNWTAR